MAEGNDKSIRIPQDGGEVLGGPDGKNHLLVIAIDEYAHCPLLNNCVKDARDFIDVLTSKYQFHPENITTLFDAEATRPKILAGLNQLKQKVQPEDNLVIYFSGHGETEDDVGYWVPVGANPDNNWEFISTYDIKSRLDPIPSFHTFIIVDACFSGSLFSTYKSVKAGYENKRSRLGLAASHSRERALDGTAGENSPFASTLLKKLRESPENLSVQKLATEVTEEVLAATRGRQTPVFKPLDVKGDDSGQYVFRLKEDEAGDWAACLDADTLLAYQAFLAKYPASQHAEAARRRVGELEEEAAWISASKTNTITAYNIFLNQYPVGLHSDDAFQAIKELEDSSLWTKAQQIDLVYAYQDYLRRFPDGRHREEARECIRKLNQPGSGTIESLPAAEEAKQEEDRRWESARTENSLKAYQDYLREYPQGRFADRAKEGLTELETVAWQHATQSNSIPAYRDFQQNFPDSKNYQEAEARIQKLQQPTEQHVLQSAPEKQELVEQAPAPPEPESMPTRRWQKDSEKQKTGRSKTGAKAPDKTGTAPSAPKKNRSLKIFFGVAFLVIAIFGSSGLWLWNGGDLPILLEQDDNAWGEANLAHTVSAYEDYLQDFYFRKHRQEAMDSINSLMDRDNQFWEKANKTHSVKAYEDYRQNYRDGIHFQEARDSINSLTNRDKQFWEETNKTHTV